MRNGDADSAIRVLAADGAHPASSRPSDPGKGPRRRWFIPLVIVGFALLAFVAATRPAPQPQAGATPSTLPPGMSAVSSELVDLTTSPSSDATTNAWVVAPFNWTGRINDIVPLSGSLVAIGRTEEGAMAWMSGTGRGWREASRFETPDHFASSVDFAAQWNGEIVALGAVGDGIGLWTAGSFSRWNYHGTQEEFGSAKLVGLAAGPELLAVGFADGALVGWTTTDGTTWSSLGPLQGANQLGFALTLAGTPSGYLLGGEGDCGRSRCLPTILRSVDAASWDRAYIEQPNPQSKVPGTVRDIVAAGDRMIAVGTEGLFPEVAVAVWTSPDGEVWTQLGADEAALRPATAEIELFSINRNVAATAVIEIDGRTQQVGVGSNLATDAGPVTVTDVVADGIRLQHDGAELLLRAGGTAKLQRISYPVSISAAGPRILIAGTEVAADTRHPIIWTSADSGTSWQRTTRPFGIGTLAGAALDGANLVAAGTGAQSQPQVWHSTWNTQRAEDEGVELVQTFFDAVERREVDAVVALLPDGPARFQIPSLAGVDLPWWDESTEAVDLDAIADTIAYLGELNTRIGLGECRTRMLVGEIDSLRVSCGFDVASDLLAAYSNGEYEGTVEIVVENGRIRQVDLSAVPSAHMWQMLTTGYGFTDQTIRALLDNPETRPIDPVFTAESAPVHLRAAEEFIAGLLRPGDTRIVETTLGTMEWSWLDPAPLPVYYFHWVTHYDGGFVAIGQGDTERWTEETTLWTSQDGFAWELMNGPPNVTGMWNLQPFRSGLIGQAWEQERSFLAFYDGDQWAEIDLPGSAAAGPYYDVRYLATSGNNVLVVTVEWGEGPESGPDSHQAWLIGPDDVPRKTTLPTGFSEQDDSIGLAGSDEGFVLATAEFGSPGSMQIWFSPDGLDWVELAATTSIEDAVYVWNLQRHNNRYFVVGEGAETNCSTAGDGGGFCEQLVGLWSSPDGADWERVFTRSGEPVGAYELGSGPLGLVAMAVDFYSERPLPRPLYLSLDGSAWERAGNLAFMHPDAEWWWASLPAVGTDRILIPGSAYQQSADVDEDTPFLIVGRLLDS